MVRRSLVYIVFIFLGVQLAFGQAKKTASKKNQSATKAPVKTGAKPVVAKPAPAKSALAAKVPAAPTPAAAAANAPAKAKPGVVQVVPAPAAATGEIPPEEHPTTVGAGPEALAPDQAELYRKIRDAITVKWFKPELFTRDNNKIKGVSLAGQTKPGTRIYLKSNEILMIKNDKDRIPIRLETKDTKFLPGMADNRGIFLFELNLKPGNYQIGVAFVDPEAQSMAAAKTFFLFLNVGKDFVDFGVREEGERDPYSPWSDYYTFGAGLNYSIFNKEVPDIPSEIRFSSFKLPSLRVGYAKSFNEEWRMTSSLLLAPGDTKDGTRVPVSSGSYLWAILSGDAIYSKVKWKMPYGDYRLRFSVRGGPQIHQIPFIYSTNFNDNTQAIKLMSYTTIGVGGQVDVLTDKPFSFETYLRVSMPFLTFSNLDISNPFSFDGSIGGVYKKKDSKWGYGIYWYGQWVQYSFSELDKFADKNVSGKFNILYSNIEFRSMLDF